MSYRQLDTNGKPLPRKGRTSRKPAERMERGKLLYHYEIYVSIPLSGGKYSYVRRRQWLPNDEAARAYETELKKGAPAEAITWRRAFERWAADNAGFSLSYLDNAATTIKLWERDFGAGSTIEGTTLAAFSEWIAVMAKDGTGRSAQNRRTHMLAIARWCRSRGLVASIPFEHSPKPADRMRDRRAASVREYHDILAVLPPSMAPMWRLLGLTGMRISAACGLLESSVTADGFTVVTKGSKEVFYGMTPEIADVFAAARAFKAAGWKKGGGKDKVVVPITIPNVFANDKGNPWIKDSFNPKLRKILTKAGLPKITPHQLRHMFGTLMAERNFSPDMIQAGLAHDSRASAESYIDQTQSMRDAALSTVAKALADVQNLSKNDMKMSKLGASRKDHKQAKASGKEHFICPRCGYNSIYNK